MIRGSNTGGRTVLLPHLAHGLNINWDEATRYAGLTSYGVSRG